MELLVFLIIVIIVAVWFSKKKETHFKEEWLKYPTLEEYWKQYPNCNTDKGTKCYNCNSNDLSVLKLVIKNDNGIKGDFIGTCNQCSTKLYRVKKED